MQKDTLVFSFEKGYTNSGNDIDLEEGSLISPSSNVIYTKIGKPTSVKNLSEIYTYGGSRASVLDQNLLGFMGNNNTTEKAIGNMIQGVGKSLWFVGNGINNAVRAFNLSSLVSIGGTSQVETMTCSGSATGSGTVILTVTGANISGSPVTVNVTTILNGDTAAQIAAKCVTFLRANAAISAQYFISRSSASVILTDKYVRANDATLNVALNPNGTGTSTVSTSTNTTAGALDTLANLSTTPQVARWNGTAWDNPTQVGVPEIDDAPALSLTTEATMSSGFTGIVTGSRTVRVARKRYGSVSIASPPSNLVEPTEGATLLVTIPPQDVDGSQKSDNVWLLYFTYGGLGSTSTHKLFPIEIPESELDGSADMTAHTDGNARYKVVSQHASDQNQRIVEVEFYDNDLLLIDPFEDYYPLDSCRFLAKLGNVMCGIGTGDDNTGFDVSYPNNHESFSPDWRDWFSEVPVAVSQEQELGFFWVCGANTTYLASWTGVTVEAAPVMLRKMSTVYGAIGQGAVVSVNGTLYMLSSGKTPVRMSPNGELDDQFGVRVIQEFVNWDSTTQLGWDEKTNSVLFANGVTILAYQIDTGLWSAPQTYTITANIDSIFSLNGNAYICYYKSGSSTYTSNKYNTGTALNWSMISNFQVGNGRLNLKDIIELKAIFSAESAGTISVYASRDFNTSVANLIHSEVVNSGNFVSARRFVDSRDYDTIALKLTGTKGGQTVHHISLDVEVHEVQRLLDHTVKTNYNSTATGGASKTICEADEDRISFFFESQGDIFTLNFGATATASNILTVNNYEAVYMDLDSPFDITQQINVYCANSSAFSAQTEE